MHITLTANIELMSNVQINGSDMSPLTGESLGRIGMGPCKKNLVMPNELATILITRVIKGRACLKLVN